MTTDERVLERMQASRFPIRWRVLDYDGNPLAGTWETEQEAVDQGLCGKYLLSGHEVEPTFMI